MNRSLREHGIASALTFDLYPNDVNCMHIAQRAWLNSAEMFYIVCKAHCYASQVWLEVE